MLQKIGAQIIARVDAVKRHRAQLRNGFVSTIKIDNMFGHANTLIFGQK